MSKSDYQIGNAEFARRWYIAGFVQCLLLTQDTTPATTPGLKALLHSFPSNTGDVQAREAGTMIGEAIGSLNGVERVYVANAEEIIQVFTVIDKRDESVRRRIYEKEIEIAQELPEHEFDFNVLAREGRPFEELDLSETDLLYSRQ